MTKTKLKHFQRKVPGNEVEAVRYSKVIVLFLFRYVSQYCSWAKYIFGEEGNLAARNLGGFGEKIS